MKVTRSSGYLSEIFLSYQGEGLLLGQRHLFVRFAGCNLRCRYCDTPESLTRGPQYRVTFPDGRETLAPNPLSAARLSEIVEEFLSGSASVDALALTGGEPLVQSGFLREWLRASKPDVPCLLETAGVLWSALERVVELLDVISMDIKLPSNSGEGPFWEEHETFLRLARKRRVYVKIPVDGTTSREEFFQAAALVARVDPSIPVFLQPISDPMGKAAAGAPYLDEFHAVARKLLADVRVTPQVHKLVGWR
ncbi:MAG: 7-carboxy-7-deazaguanine synthase [Candidatus Binatia bacterium]|nr:MAG: 7-carboxy-7-deazaguanine synthase [Candidatus Binatia bacterium]